VRELNEQQLSHMAKSLWSELPHEWLKSSIHLPTQKFVSGDPACEKFRSFAGAARNDARGIQLGGCSYTKCFGR